MSIFTEVQDAVNRCVLNIDSSPESKVKAISAFLDLIDNWRDEEARAFIAATDDPDFDLSPAQFDKTFRMPVKATVSAF